MGRKQEEFSPGIYRASLNSKHHNFAGTIIGGVFFYCPRNNDLHLRTFRLMNAEQYEAIATDPRVTGFERMPDNTPTNEEPMAAAICSRLYTHKVDPEWCRKG